MNGDFVQSGVNVLRLVADNFQLHIGGELFLNLGDGGFGGFDNFDGVGLGLALNFQRDGGLAIGAGGGAEFRAPSSAWPMSWNGWDGGREW